MSGTRRAPTFASDDWMLEQQLRAEMEAEAWRRLREALWRPELATLPPPVAPQNSPEPVPASTRAEQIERGGSIVLKALVRFALAAFGAYLAWIAAMDGGMGEFEVWLATGAGFLITLSLSMFDPARRFVHALSEFLRYALIAGAAVGIIWIVLHLPNAPA